MSHIPLHECYKGYVYKLNSRNLSYGVFDGQDGFIGIREKFDSKFLFKEYHYDSPAFATAKPILQIEKIPGWIEIREQLATVCGDCGRLIKAIPIGDTPIPVKWEHVPLGNINVDYSNCRIHPVSLENSYLFDFLKKYE